MAAVDIYERINAMWRGDWREQHGFFVEHYDPPPRLVRETEGWHRGWSLLRNWAAKDEMQVGEPILSSAEWANEVHIFSHATHISLTSQTGHSLRQAEIEEEGTRLIICWWMARKAPSAASVALALAEAARRERQR
jgi:hypothetical protein